LKNYKILIAAFAAILLLGTFYAIKNHYEPLQIYFSDRETVPSYQKQDNSIPLKIAMISVLNHQETMKYQNQLARAIGEKLGRSVLVLHRRSYAEINYLLTKGEADIALLSTGAYCIYGKNAGFALLAMQERNNLPYYYGYIIVAAGNKAASLEDLKDKSFAYVDPLSYSGYLGLQQKIEEKGYLAEGYFKSTYFTYSHDESIKQVINGLVDGAVIDSLAYDYLEKNQPEMLDKIKIIETLPAMGTGPFVARKNLENIQEVQSVLLHIHEDTAGRQALDNLMIDRLILPQPELYPQIRTNELKR